MYALTRLAGCHADVGGGSHNTDEEPSSLSNIPLRWMIKECFLAKTGINFDQGLLTELGLDLTALEKNPATVPTHNYADPSGPGSDILEPNSTEIALRFQKDLMDASALIYNQLFIAPFWWLLEVIPMISTHQEHDGSWLRFRMSDQFVHFPTLPH